MRFVVPAMLLVLLASDYFGEHLAVDWLDTARYADTNGYFSDTPRQIWLWGNWVIYAFTSNTVQHRASSARSVGLVWPPSTTFLPLRVITRSPGKESTRW